MPDIHIHRDHALGLNGAREVATGWAEKAESKFDMSCRYEEGEAEDVLHFSRVGAEGTLRVNAEQFELQAKLGFLLGSFKDQIEQEIGRQLDELIGRQHPV